MAFFLVFFFLKLLCFGSFHCMDSVTEIEGIDRGVLMRALRQLEQKGKATIFKGTSADDEGVKFSV